MPFTEVGHGQDRTSGAPVGQATAGVGDVESGYVVVRSTREGLLTVSDAIGCVIAERSSAVMPGTTMLVTTSVPRHSGPVYARIGEEYGASVSSRSAAPA